MAKVWAEFFEIAFIFVYILNFCHKNEKKRKKYR